MPLYEISLHRRVTTCRIMRVEAKDEQAARRRALGLLRIETGGDYSSSELSETEREGEWCDDDWSRAVVDKIAKVER